MGRKASRKKRSGRWILFLLVVLALVITYRQEIVRVVETLDEGVETRDEGTIGEPNGNAFYLGSWNVYNFGQSKDDDEIAFIAEQLEGFDIVALQEVSVSSHGAQAVARLVEALNRRGSRWDYSISPPTTGRGSERYAYVWKTARLRPRGRAWLEPSLEADIDREPYLMRVEYGGGEVLLASFHAVPQARDPELECALLVRIHDRYPNDSIIIMGDFNLYATDEAFDALRRRGYRAALVDQPTTLKMRQGDQGERLLNAYDNFFYEYTELRLLTAGAMDFTRSFRTLRSARSISDHLPIYLSFERTTP